MDYDRGLRGLTVSALLGAVVFILLLLGADALVVGL